ncbi:MAG: cysteine--tRNA ligase [Candidatus Manganitrophus sp.]|nr:MAG: cysteine--tRNA ligase [Candidatus Manganitrophus sp.]
MLKISNTLSGEKEPWSPMMDKEVRLYVCGVTVYDHCHLGHARSAIVFDVVRNYLEYKGLSVRYVKNFTDVDDKIIRRAQQEGKEWKEIAEKYIASYEEDMARLGVRPPMAAPKATEYIPEMIGLIETLISKGIAYPVDGDVYYEVAKFPSYGKLSKQKLDEMISGARVEVDERKKSPLDFALWKSSKPGEPAWESPWGMGRPGWHIECSAMSMKLFGETLDLHGGGKDLIFPHHENEIAQSEAATGKDFVRSWIHHGFVTVDQEKMSKSLGNFFTVKEIFEKLRPVYRKDEVIAEVIRFYLLSTHYRSPLDFSDQSLKTAKSGLTRFYELFRNLEETGRSSSSATKDATGWERYREAFGAAMDDDFNTARAIGVLQEFRSEINVQMSKASQTSVLPARDLLRDLGGVLGIFRVPLSMWPFHTLEAEPGRYDIEGVNASLQVSIDDNTVQAFVREREEARRKKDWKKSDEIRDRLAQAGIVLEDRPDGTTRVKR